MCHQTTCDKCNKASWSGCGNHLQGIFQNIPVEKRCFCGYSKEELEKEKRNPTYPNLGPLPKGQEGGCIIS
eukprot:gene7122-11285_t